VKKLLVEKIPLFVLVALSSIVTFIAQQKGGAVQSIEVFTPCVRIANALVSYILYIRKMVWPTDLTVFYPHPGLRPFWQVLGAVLLLGAVTSMVIRTAKSFPYLVVGWLWYVGTLVPVIGIVQVGAQALADRYTYVPLIGLFIMAAWGIPALFENWRYRREAFFASSSLALLSIFIITRTQIGYWHNSITLYDHTLKLTNRNYLIQYNRSLVYAKLGNYRQAILDFDRAVEINHEYAEAYNNRGVVHDELGNLQQAISDYNRAIQINSEYADAYNNLGAAHGELDNLQQAVLDFDRAVEINPKYAAAYINRGIAYGKLGNQRQATDDLQKAARLGDEEAKDLLKSQGMSW
jgi:hypothetical protein